MGKQIIPNGWLVRLLLNTSAFLQNFKTIAFLLRRTIFVTSEIKY